MAKLLWVGGKVNKSKSLLTEPFQISFVAYRMSIASSKLHRADTESDTVPTNLWNLANSADLSLILW